MFLSMAKEVKKQRSQRANSEAMEMGTRKRESINHTRRQLDALSVDSAVSIQASSSSFSSSSSSHNEKTNENIKK